MLQTLLLLPALLASDGSAAAAVELILEHNAGAAQQSAAAFRAAISLALSSVDNVAVLTAQLSISCTHGCPHLSVTSALLLPSVVTVFNSVHVLKLVAISRQLPLVVVFARPLVKLVGTRLVPHIDGDAQHRDSVCIFCISCAFSTSASIGL